MVEKIMIIKLKHKIKIILLVKIIIIQTIRTIDNANKTWIKIKIKKRTTDKIKIFNKNSIKEITIIIKT